MAYALLNPTFAAQFDAFTRARGFAFALLWNPKIHRWVLAQRLVRETLTHDLLLGIPSVSSPRCRWEPLFICSDSENGCLREPGPWIFAEIAKRAKRGDDKKAKDDIVNRARAHRERQDRLARHYGQHTHCYDCERSIAELRPELRNELETLDRDWQTYGVGERKSFIIAKG